MGAFVTSASGRVGRIARLHRGMCGGLHRYSSSSEVERLGGDHSSYAALLRRLHQRGGVTLAVVRSRPGVGRGVHYRVRTRGLTEKQGAGRQGGICRE